MKNYLIGIVLLLTTLNLSAQRKVEKQIIVNPKTILNLKLEFADTIKIVQSTDNTVRVIASVNINDNLNNDNYELIANQSDGLLKISAKIHDMKSIRVPCTNKKGSNYNYYNGKCLTMDISYVIEVPNIAKIEIETISGNIIIGNTISNLSLNSISGFIDIGISNQANSNLKIETVTGGVYSNYEFGKTNNLIDSNPGGTSANFKIGNGENSMRLTTVSGDIFIRKI